MQIYEEFPRKNDQHRMAAKPDKLSKVTAAIATTGRSLAGDVRANMETRSGRNFGGVRVHDDDAAHDRKHNKRQAEETDPRLQGSFAQRTVEATLHAAVPTAPHRMPPEVRRALSFSVGERLPEPVAAAFGNKFARDLSGVRIHRDRGAAEAVRSIGANAFARGRDLYFREGTYQPDSLSGQVLLAHELAHTIQQSQTGKVTPSLNTSRAEEHAERAALHHAAGHPFLNAGQAAPVSIAADNGVTYEDEEGQVSRLGTDDEAADKVADLQKEADLARAAASVTDSAVAAKDQKAQELRDAVQASVAKKQAAARKKGKGKTSGAVSASVINSSPDLTSASSAEIEQHQHQLEKVIALTPDPKQRVLIAKEQENTQALGAAAKSRERLEHLMARISDQRSDIEFLERNVHEAHELRESTSSWVTGPTHAYGGSWNEIEIEQFQGTYTSLGKAQEAAKAGRMDEAEKLLHDSWSQWWDLNHRFEEYADGIQKGGNRVVTGIKIVERINRGVASLNPAVGFAYSFGQDSLQQSREVSLGQRDSVDYWGNLKSAAESAAINKIAAGGSSLAGESAAPLLSGLGRFSGAGKLVVEQGTGILISSGLTGTSPVDALTDPATYLVPIIGQGYAHAGGQPDDHAQADAHAGGHPDDHAQAHAHADGQPDDSNWHDVNRELGLDNPPLSDPMFGPSEPVHTIDDPNKSKGVLAEATVPFDRYQGTLPLDPSARPGWNNFGGGSETASSRENLARQSKYDKALGQEGTAGTDYLAKYEPTGRLVIGEQKATQGDSFTDATSITTSLESNVERNIEVLENKIKSGTIKDPAEVGSLEKTIDQLKGTLDALKKGRAGEDVQLPDGVVFELTNVGGEGKQIGKQHIDLLAKRYGHNPKFLEHLLDRTFVRDPVLARAKGRSLAGAPGTDFDPETVPAKDILTPNAKDTLDRLQAGKTEEQWEALKAQEKAKQLEAEQAQREGVKKQREDAETRARERAREVGERVRQERLKLLQDEKTQKNTPEPRTKRQRDQARKLENQAERAGTQAEKAEFDKFRKARKQQDADALAARKAQEKAKQDAIEQKREAERQAELLQAEQRKQAESEAAVRRAERKAIVDKIRQRYEARKAQEHAVAANNAAASQADKTAKSPQQTNNVQEAQAAQTQATGTEGNQTNASGKGASKTGISGSQANRPEASKTGTGTNESHTDGTAQHQVKQTTNAKGQNTGETNHPEPTGTAHENTSQLHENTGERIGGKAIHAANQAAGSIRAYDAYQDARKQNKSRVEASLEAAKAYLTSTNPVAGAASTAIQRMQKDENGTQYYGNDPLDAWLGTIGETGAGYIVPGAGWDQAINAGGNLTDAVDDHLQKNRDPKDPANNKATLRTGADLAVDLTPSKAFSQLLGAGTRAYYDIGRAIGGDTTGVDKFGEDATRGKLGSVLQPFAMAADFVGNLGNSTASQALDKTIKKTEGTTLKKIGDASGDAVYNLGQNKDAKAGKYGAAVQGVSDMLSISSEMIAGKSFDKALNEAADAGKGSIADTVGSAIGDVAFKTVEKGKEIINEDIPAVKKKASEMIDQSKEKLSNWWKSL
jgi:Domain of unknown function (DUF4157)